MPHVWHLEALGSTFVVTAPSGRDAALLERQWSRLRVDAEAATVPIPLDLRQIPAENQGRALLSQVTTAAIEAAAGTRLMLHAAGVCDPEGRVLALVGPSGMGKSTAAVYLSRHGFGYVTDETVSIGPDRGVLPFGRPLSLRQPGGDVQRSPDDLGLGVPAEELRVARVVLLDRVPGLTDPPTLTAVALVDALLELIPHASALATLPDPLQFLSSILEGCGGVVRLVYGDMDERVASLLSESLAQESPVRDRWRALPPQADAATGPGSLRSADVDDQPVFQGRLSDGITADGEALVLVGNVPVRLSPIGLAIWEAARGGATYPDIVSRVQRDHGVHPDAAEIVRHALSQLLEAHVLVAAPAPPR